jgi:hypothetical protein
MAVAALVTENFPLIWRRSERGTSIDRYAWIAAHASK